MFVVHGGIDTSHHPFHLFGGTGEVGRGFVREGSKFRKSSQPVNINVNMIIYSIFFMIINVFKFQVDSYKYTRRGRVEAQINIRYKGLLIAVTLPPDPFRVSCERPQIAAGNIESCLSERQFWQKIFKVISSVIILYFHKIAIFDIEVRALMRLIPFPAVRRGSLLEVPSPVQRPRISVV